MDTVNFGEIAAEAILKNLIWLLPVLILIAFLKSSWFKGIMGEALVKLAAKLRLSRKTYQPIHNVTLPTPDGSTQIDHVFVSRFGIFVIETKNMKGWIFGGETQRQWTQKIFKKSFKFQNPLHQNYKHVKALEAALDVPAERIHSVVVFAGDCTLKSPMPPNVVRGLGFVRYIQSFRDIVFSEAEVKSLVEQIESGRFEPSRQTHREHVQRLKQRSDPNTARRCPACGNDMILRVARKGSNAGKRFWGCVNYPSCRVVQRVD